MQLVLRRTGCRDSDQSTVMEVAPGTVVMNPGDPVEGAYVLEQAL